MQMRIKAEEVPEIDFLQIDDERTRMDELAFGLWWLSHAAEDVNKLNPHCAYVQCICLLELFVFIAQSAQNAQTNRAKNTSNRVPLQHMELNCWLFLSNGMDLTYANIVEISPQNSRSLSFGSMTHTHMRAHTHSSDMHAVVALRAELGKHRKQARNIE